MFLKNLWNFRGLSSNIKRFSKDNATKIVYLLDPNNAAKIMAASRNVIPVKLRSIHAFHDDIGLIKKLKFNLAIASSSVTPSLKKKINCSQNRKDFAAYATKRLIRIS
jgi:hypothetical protein